MPFTLKVLGISNDRVTFGIDANFRGQKVAFHQKTYSMEPGEELHMALNVHLEGFGDLPDQQTELEMSLPDGLYAPNDLPFLYKVESE